MKKIFGTLAFTIVAVTACFAQDKSQAEKEDAVLQQYFKEHKLKPSKTPSGLYYIITQKGEGDNAKSGQTVSVNYTGKTMDGKPFDSNVDPAFGHVQPLTFGLGARQVIAGWDEGIALLNKGAKGVLYIPSSLAYGPTSPTPAIPPYSILIFDVELTGIQ